MGIPVVDCRRLDEAATVRVLGEGLEDYGFVALDRHGVPPHLLERSYACAAATFALPDAVKRRYETPADGRQRGYTPFGVEHAKDQRTADLKEFWHVGRDLGEHRLHASGAIPVNRSPVEIPAFAETFGELFATMDGVSVRMLQAIGTFLGWGPEVLPAAVRHGNSVLRVIHYPPLPADRPANAVRAAQHEDINLLTVLPVSTQPGLELLRRDGTWMAVDPPPGVLVCDTGDMMARMTGGRLPATTHRVVNPPGTERTSRYSMPFFCHPRPEVVLAPPGSGGGPTAGAFLRQRLVATGVA